MIHFLLLFRIYYRGVPYFTNKPVKQLNDSDDSYNEDD
jgi:hypothetical protein